jgi:hypothetical protein
METCVKIEQNTEDAFKNRELYTLFHNFVLWNYSGGEANLFSYMCFKNTLSRNQLQKITFPKL